MWNSLQQIKVFLTKNFLWINTLDLKIFQKDLDNMVFTHASSGFTISSEATGLSPL